MSRDPYGYNQHAFGHGSPDTPDRNPLGYANQGGYFNSGQASTPDSEYDRESHGLHPPPRPSTLLRSDTEVEIGSGSGYGGSGDLRTTRPGSLLRTDTHQGSGYDPRAQPNPLQRADSDIKIGAFERPNLLRSDTDFEDPGSDQPVQEHEGSHRTSARHQDRYGEYTDRERQGRGAGSGAYYEGERTYGGGRHGGTTYEEKYGRPGGYGDDEGDGGYSGYTGYRRNDGH